MTLAKKVTTTLAAGLVAATTLTACGDDTGSSGGQPIDHDNLLRSLRDNAETGSEDLGAALAYSRHTDLLGDAIDAFGTTTCIGPADPEGTAQCETTPIEDQLADGADGLIHDLANRVFIDSNIERETSQKITYLVAGSSVCMTDAAEVSGEVQADQQRCADAIDRLEIRLTLTSPAEGDVDIDLLIGPTRYNPLDIGLQAGKVTATTDLAEVRSMLTFLNEQADGSLPDLPDTMRGKLRAVLQHDGQGKLVATLSVLDKIQVTGQERELTVGEADPAAQITVDQTAKSIRGLLDLGTIDLRAPVTDEDEVYHEQTDSYEHTETTYDLLAHLSGAKFQANYPVDQERIDIQNIGIGTSTSTLDVDGNRIIELDLNPNQGRTINASIFNAPNGTKVEVTPALDIELMVKFAQIQNKLDTVADWALDNFIQITLDGATTPTVQFQDDDLAVLQGTLTLSSEDQQRQVDAGQCLLSDSPVRPQGGAGTGNEPPAEDSSNPFDHLTVGSCSQ